MSAFVNDPRSRSGDLRVEVNDVRREKNALGKEEFVPQQTEAVHGDCGGGATNFEKVRKGEWGKRRREKRTLESQ